MDSTRSQVRPWGSRPRGEVATILGMGMYTTRLFTRPVLKFVYPAIAPCTAYKALRSFSL